MSSRIAEAKNHIHHKEFIQALELGQSLVRMGQDVADAHTIVGIAASSLGNQKLAQSAFQKAANLAPQSSVAWANLGRVASTQKDFPLMQSAFSKAWQLQPADADIGYHLADAYVKLADFKSASAIIEKVLTFAPGHAKAEALNLTLQTDNLPMNEWSALWRNLPVEQWPIEFRCLVAQLKTIWSWGHMPEDFSTYLYQLRLLVNQAHSQGLAEVGNIKNAYAYLSMFEVLAASGTPPKHDPSLPPLYMLGDSHVLPPQNQIVSWNGARHQITSQLVVGIKFWDLVNPSGNMVREVFLLQLARIPSKATVIISVGEIDARPIYGVYKHAREHNKPWQPIIEATIPPALAWLKQHQGDRTFIIPGIPTPHTVRKQIQIAPEHQLDYLACATAINESLKTEAARHGFPVIDLFTYTTENPSSFAEDFHLLPTALPEALQSHLILPATAA